MTNLEKIEFIDEFLSELEDVLHGTEGLNCTKSRKHLEELKEAINFNHSCVTDKSKEVTTIDIENKDRGEAFNTEVEQLVCEDCQGWGWIADENGRRKGHCYKCD